MMVLLFLGVLVPATLAQSEPFFDTIGHPQAMHIETLRIHNIVQGYGYGLYRPDMPVNRAEFLKILMLAAYGEQGQSEAATCFTDFIGEPQWFWGTACAALYQGILTGYPDGTFRGTQRVNLAEALAMAQRAWQIPAPYYVHEPPSWYDKYFDAVLDRGVAEYFLHNPDHPLTRGDAAWLLVALGQPIATVEEIAFSSSVSSFSSETSASSVSSVSPSVHSVCGNGIKEGVEQCDDGNREDGDGCSSLCIIVPQTLQHSAIRLDQRALGTDMFAGGTTQTILFSFDANAHWQDAILTGLKFDAVEGTFSAAVNYRLYQDEDGDGRPESLVGVGIVRSNVLSFSTLDARIHTMRGTRFEVRADLVQTSGSLAIGFRTSDDAYVEAVGAIDGWELIGIRTDQAGCPRADSCWIAVYTLDSVPVELSERGNLFVTQSSQPVRSRQLLAGAKTDDLLRFSFRATDEDIRIRRITISGATDAVAELQFFEPAASAPFAVAHTSGCRVPAAGTFCTAVNLIVKKDILRDVIVRAVLKSADDGARSGDTVTLTLPADTSVTDVAVEATGIASQKDLAQNDGDFSAEGEIFIGRAAAGANSAIVGSTHDVVHAGVRMIENAASETVGTFIPVGQYIIGTFRFTAHEKPAMSVASRSVTLNTITFDITATNVLFSAESFALVNTMAPTIAVPCTETARTGSIRVTCSGLSGYGVNAIIPFGGFVTLGLRGFIENAQAPAGGSSMLQVSLTSLSDRGIMGGMMWNDGASAFTWVDVGETEVRSTLYQMP